MLFPHNERTLQFQKITLQIIVRQEYQTSFQLSNQQNKMKTTTRSQIIQKNSDIDETSSMTSSTVSSKLMRRRDQKSIGKRSSSKKSQESYHEDSNLKSVFIKLSLPGNKPEIEAVSPRVNVGLASKGSTGGTAGNQKKRQLTPCKSRIDKVRGEKQTAIQKEINYEKELMIADLEQKYQYEKKIRQTFEKKAATFQAEVISKLKKIQQLEKTLAKYMEKDKANMERLKQLESQAHQKEENLNQVKTNLERLKKNIRLNREAQLQNANIKLVKEIESLNQKIVQLNLQIQAGQDANKKLQQQLKEQNQKTEMDKFIKAKELKEKEIQTLKAAMVKSKSERQLFLQQILIKKEQESFILKLENQKLQININYINRKKTEELQKLKTKKDIDLQTLRGKLSKLMGQFTDQKREIQALRRKNSLFLSVQHCAQQLNRSNTFMDRNNSPLNNSCEITLELSP